MADIVKLDPKQFGLEETKAADIAAQFKPMLDKMVELEAEYNEVIAIPIEEAGSKAKALRLKYVKVRTGTDKIHKEQKAFYLSAGRFVDGWKNAQLFASQGIEKKLEDIENYVANKEKERIAALQTEREAALAQYEVDSVQQLSLGQMTEQVWRNFLTGTISNYEARKEAERVAEEQRLAAIKAEQERIEAQRAENERLKAEAEAREKELAEQRRKAEAEKKALEDAARIEREAAELKLKEERRIAAEKLAKEQEAARKLAAELQAKKDAEDAARKEAARIEAERIAAEKKAAKAPVKEKLSIAVNALTLELPESDITPEILAKFTGFKQWALTQINNL